MSKSKKKKKQLSPEKVLKKQSKAFYALPKNEQRKKVAMDVIYLLKNKMLNLQSQELFAIDTESMVDIKNGEQLALYLPYLLEKKHCFVCGLGACFVSIVNLADNYKVKTKISQNDAYKRQYKHVIKVFGHRNAAMIEVAFERGSGSLGIYAPTKKKGKKLLSGLSDDDFGLATAFGWQQDNNPYKRLIKIMENIIEFDGEFMPPDEDAPRKLSLPMELKKKK